MASVTPQTANDLMTAFSNTVSAGFDALQGSVNGVFGTMIALVVALTGVQWALSPNRDLLAAGFGKVLLIGAFAYIINDWRSLTETIYGGFIDLGLRAGGGGTSRSDFLNPGAILDQGWQIVKAIGDTPTSSNPVAILGNLTDALILGVAMIGIMLAFAVLALQIIVALLEFKIVTLGGFVLLPFGIWSKSAFLAERPLGFVASSGLKILALAIVVSGARSVFAQLQPSADPDIYEALAILVAAILLAMLAVVIPNLAAALVTGGPALAAGSALTGALAVGGAAALSGAAVVGAGALGGRAASAIAGASRIAARAGAGRPPPPPGGAPPGPTNDNPPPSGPRPGGAAAAGPAGSPRSAAATPGGEAGAETPAGPGGAARPGAQIAREAGAARTQFRRAAAADGTDAGQARASRRSAALQAFFAANAARGLLPAAESSGSLQPNLKPEEP
jgi:type IV secretion system protein TrbL